MNTINEEHMGPDYTPEQARQLVKMMDELGHDVAYGPARKWEFAGDDHRALFESDFDECIAGIDR